MKFKNRDSFFIFLIAALTLVVYSNSLFNEFLYDDEHLILKNRYIRDFRYIPNIFTENAIAGAYLSSNYYRPLQLLLYSIIYHLFGLNVVSYHLLNILLHAANGILIYLIFKKLFKKRLTAFIPAIIFSLHPVNTEAVTYISGTADPTKNWQKFI